MAQIGDAAAIGPRESGDQPQKSRFAGPGPPEESHNLTLVESEIDAIENDEFAAARFRKGATHAVNVEQDRSFHRGHLTRVGVE
jgi:hypothetical protein